MNDAARSGSTPFVAALRHRHRLPGPVVLATVSGVAATSPEMLDWFATQTPVTVLTTKSIQPEANPGNREPVITEPQPGSFGNAVGLRNPGVDAAAAGFARLARRAWPAGRLLLISIAAATEDAFAALALRLAPFADAIELNLSCPHAHGGYGAAIGCDPMLVRRVTAATVAALAASDGAPIPVIAKLTPNVADIGAIAVEAIAAGATGISAINTVGPVQYLDASSGAPILTNPAPAWARGTDDEERLVGLGGQSGRWIHARALEAVASVRAAVGADPIIIGMGGVEDAHTARAMREAGADAVGVGSAFALAPQRQWPALLAAIATGAAEATGDGAATDAPHSARQALGVTRRAVPHASHRVAPPAPPVALRASAAMAFRRMVVTARRELGAETFELELDGATPAVAGQVYFLWIPGVGEKPYAAALERPASFVMRRRGPHTTALGALATGDAVWVRGPYGDGAGVASLDAAAPLPAAPGARPAIIVAGSGTALAPPLVAAFRARGAEPRVWVGLRDGATRAPFAAALVDAVVVPDAGEPARVVDRFRTREVQMRRAAATGRSDSAPRHATSIWAVGPEPFMAAAVAAGRDLGIAPEAIVVSVEERMMCGVGLCGLCHHRGILTCSEGTLLPADAWHRGTTDAPSEGRP